MNWWQRLAMTTLLAFLQSTIKNPKALAQEKSVLLAIRDAINALFPGE